MSVRWWVGVTIALALLVLMIYGVYQYREPVTAKHEMAILPWGVTVVGYIFFALLSGGITDSVIIHAYLERLEAARRVLRKTLLGSFAVLIPGIVLVFCDILHPEHSIWFYASFNPSSRIAWNALLYILYTIFLLAFLVALIRLGEENLDKGLFKALALAVVLVSLNLEVNLGMAYGVNIAVPAWYGAYAGMLFLAIAFTLGSAWETLQTPTMLKDAAGREELIRSYAWEHLFATSTLALLLFWGLLARVAWGPAAEYLRLLLTSFSPIFVASILLAIVIPLVVDIAFIYRVAGYRALQASMLLSLVGVALYMLVPFNYVSQMAKFESSLYYRLLAQHIGVETISLTKYLAGPETLAFIGAFSLWLLIELVGRRVVAVEVGEKPRLLVFR